MVAPPKRIRLLIDTRCETLVRQRPGRLAALPERLEQFLAYPVPVVVQ